MDDLKRYEELVKTIEYHNDRYYNQDDPEISDYEYDMMMKELKKLEKDHPESHQVRQLNMLGEVLKEKQEF